MLVSPAKGETTLGFSRPLPGEGAPPWYAPEGRFTLEPQPYYTQTIMVPERRKRPHPNPKCRWFFQPPEAFPTLIQRILIPCVGGLPRWVYVLGRSSGFL